MVAQKHQSVSAAAISRSLLEVQVKTLASEEGVDHVAQTN